MITEEQWDEFELAHKTLIKLGKDEPARALYLKLNQWRHTGACYVKGPLQIYALYLKIPRVSVEGYSRFTSFVSDLRKAVE